MFLKRSGKQLNLRDALLAAEAKGVAVGHFNISDTMTLQAIFNAARKLNVPVIIGTSEGERDFIGARQAIALVRTLRETFNYPIFTNADHTHSFEKVKEAVAVGYDAILFDGGKLSLDENISETRRVVEYVRAHNPDILIEGELGYIGSSSEMLEKIPDGAAIDLRDLTTAEDAARFVQGTKVDLLAPAVGNIHGMFANAPNPALNINRIFQIHAAVTTPLVLHGGSGTSDSDFRDAMKAGIRIIHINTEIRLAWRKGVEAGLQGDPKEVAPYKLMKPALDKIEEVVYNRLTLFNRTNH
jgi:fructose-bisphosphate aldolase class II